MARGLSSAAKKAADYVKKNPDKLTADQVAKKFGLSPTTVYRSEWWKQRHAAAAQ